MKFVRKILARGRVRSARKALAANPSPAAYEALAQEYIRAGLLADAVVVCDEALHSFSGNTLLSRLAERTRRAEREERMARVRRELIEAPRPALWSEMCEIQLELGTLAKAEITANQWIEGHDDGEARFMLARVRAERFFADRGRDLGLAAISALEDACRALPNDVRPQRGKLILLMRIGAWRDARETAKLLLELDPGAPELEGKFRSLEDLAENAPTVGRALIQVEKTGHFVGDEHQNSEGAEAAQGTTNVRPTLRKLADDGDVHAALYLRGSTVLIQGPKGATAERMARGVRSILSSGRSTSRKLGLGQVFQMQIEGDFGKLSIAPGETDAGAVWSTGALGRRREEALLGLAGTNADLGSDAVEVAE